MTRLLGLPLFAIAWGSQSGYRPRTVCGWIAVGDIAVSPFLAFGGFAVAPIAVGAITAGVLSLSVFWGVAFGVFALGSLAFGWWALGCAAVGVKCAVGFAAVARDYAVGIVTSATEAGTAANAWVKTQWLGDFVDVIVHQLHWWILGCVALAPALRVWRDRQQRREAQLDSDPGGCWSAGLRFCPFDWKTLPNVLFLCPTNASTPSMPCAPLPGCVPRGLELSVTCGKFGIQNSSNPIRLVGHFK